MILLILIFITKNNKFRNDLQVTDESAKTKTLLMAVSALFRFSAFVFKRKWKVFGIH